MAGDYTRSAVICLVVFSLVLSPMLPCATATARPPRVYCPACVCCAPPPPGGGCCRCRCTSGEPTTAHTGTP
ncbi:hypothetical protein GQ457_09G006150 [Hibiscus cannabinus]